MKFMADPSGMCCNNGKVVLPSLTPPPEPLASLLMGSHEASREFLPNVMRYNACFQMTSFGTTAECSKDEGSQKARGVLYSVSVV